MVPEQPDGVGEPARQQVRFHLVALEPPQRRMVRPCAQRQGGPEFLGAGQQSFSAPIVQVHIFFQTQAGEQRRLGVPFWRKVAGMIRQLLPCDLPGQACEAKSSMAFHGKSPPSPQDKPGAEVFDRAMWTELEKRLWYDGFRRIKPLLLHWSGTATRDLEEDSNDTPDAHA
jgi:hypothetical protein